MNIPFGFKLITNNFHSFKKELNDNLFKLALHSFLNEYVTEQFNIYDEKESYEKNISVMKKKYEEILIDIKKVEDTGIRNFLIPDVLTKIIYLKKDNIYYGIIDSDVFDVKEFFFNHKDIEHFTPNAWDISDEEIKNIRETWEILLPSLLARDGDYFVLEDNVFKYPSFEELLDIFVHNEYISSNKFYENLISENVMDILLKQLEEKTKKEKNVEVITYDLLNKREIMNLLNNKKMYTEEYFKEHLIDEFNLFEVKYKSFIAFIKNNK